MMLAPIAPPNAISLGPCSSLPLNDEQSRLSLLTLTEALRSEQDGVILQTTSSNSFAWTNAIVF